MVDTMSSSDVAYRACCPASFRSATSCSGDSRSLSGRFVRNTGAIMTSSAGPNARAKSRWNTLRLDEAERHFRTLLRLNAGHAAARIGLAELSHARGRVEETRRLLPLCLTNAHTARRANTLLAQVERQLGNTAPADAALRRVTTLPADLPWPDSFLADAAQFRIGRKAWTDQAQSWLDHGRHGEEQPIVARLIKDYPEAPDGWLFLGRMRL